MQQVDPTLSSVLAEAKTLVEQLLAAPRCAIPDPDLCSAVEALTVRLLRRQGCKLLNA
jgi:hypothetical protein